MLNNHYTKKKKVMTTVPMTILSPSPPLAHDVCTINRSPFPAKKSWIPKHPHIIYVVMVWVCVCDRRFGQGIITQKKAPPFAPSPAHHLSTLPPPHTHTRAVLSSSVAAIILSLVSFLSSSDSSCICAMTIRTTTAILSLSHPLQVIILFALEFGTIFSATSGDSLSLFSLSRVKQ